MPALNPASDQGPSDTHLQAPPAAPPNPIPPEGVGAAHDGFQPTRLLTGLLTPNPLPGFIRDAYHPGDPIQVLLYYDPNPLGREVTLMSPLRAASLTAFEQVSLTFTTSGIDGTRGAHIELRSESLGIRRTILHWQAFGPILPLSEFTGGALDPDVGYAERYGHHHRRGLVIRFPPDSGTTIMAQWNSHRSALVAGERAGSHPSRPQTVGLFDVTHGEDGTCKFYLMSHELLSSGDTYAHPGIQEEWRISRGKRVVLSLSSTDTRPPTISIRPDNSRAAEECFPLDLCTFTVRETPKGGQLRRHRCTGAVRPPPPSYGHVVCSHGGCWLRTPRHRVFAALQPPRTSAQRITTFSGCAIGVWRRRRE